MDASVVAAALAPGTANSAWAYGTLFSDDLIAPSHLHVEVAQAIRRWKLAGLVEPADAAAAHADLVALDVSVHPYDLVADRVWELHPNVSAYDAAYVALAELFDVPLATLDDRLAHATGPTCRFLVP